MDPTITADLTLRLESALLDQPDNQRITLSRVTAKQLFDLLNEHSLEELVRGDIREEPLMYVSNEDLVTAGVDPSTVSDEKYEKIVEDMTEYLEESFSDALHCALTDNGVERTEIT